MPTKPIPDARIDLPLQTRAAPLVPGSANTDARTIELVWSTGATVRRHDMMTGEPYDEQLVLEPGACDLSRLNGGAPFLNTHGAWDLSGIIGVVERAWIADGGNGPEGRAVVRFSDRADVEPVWRDVAAGIVRNVSVGYAVRTYEVTEAEDQVPLWRAIDWQPMELSAVPIGADAGAGFRSADRAHPCRLVHHQEAAMSDEPTVTTNQDAPAPVAAAEPSPPPPPQQQQPDPATVAERAVAAERFRIAGIYDAQGKLNVARTVADGLVTRGIALDDARRILIDEAAKADARTETRAVVVPGGQDETVTRRSAVEGALLHRFDPSAHALDGPAREWRGLTLLEMGRAFLEAEGTRTRGLSRDEVATRALHAGSDFPHILAGVANRTLRRAYETAPRTFQPFCRQITAADFKAMHRVQLGEAPALEKVGESGVFKRGTIGEGEESYRVETYGKIFAITRQVIINDDLDAFTRVPQLFGTSAANLESDVVWGIFVSNPAMADGKALFHADHANQAATGTKLGVEAVGHARAAMARQTGVDGETILNIRPAFLIVPASLELSAEQLIAINIVPAKSGDVVPASIRTLAVIAEPRLDPGSTIAWYLAASPTQIDTIEYAYLEGQQGVYIETRVGFDVDGVEIKARLDFGAKAIDWRGLYRDPGSAT